VSLPSDDLQLPTGGEIQDGSGTARVETKGFVTEVNDNTGDTRLEAFGGGSVRLTALSGKAVRIRDGQGGFNAVQYASEASAPGTLELVNANLGMDAREIQWDAVGQGAGLRWPDQGGGSDPLLFVDSSGEVKVRNDDGNITQLT
jgi:hypothetical protein